MQTQHLFNYLLAISITLLTACGGGGGSSSTPATNPVVLTPSITTANASDLYLEAALAINMVDDSRIIYLELKTRASAGNIATYSVASGVTTACSASGTFNLKYNDLDNSGTVSAGDNWVYTYASCVATGSSSSYTGTETYTVNSLSGTSLTQTGSTAWNATATKVRNYTVTNAGVGTYVFNTTVPHTIAVATTDTLTATATATTASLVFTPSADSTDIAFSITGVSGTLNYGGYIYAPSTYTRDGTVYVSGANAAVNSGAAYTVSFAYPVTLSGAYNGGGVHAAPTTGSTKLTGASSTSASHNAPFTSFTLDSNGDGVTDATAAFNYSTSLTP